MGRPEPSVLFAQTFVHPQLDEYVDEVLFAEPIIVTACEFLEQNLSSASSSVTLLGATSPPSFALEVFVHCEGETRFRRLCQPFLYSPSSSNVLEVEGVVTSHLVVRGSYRSLSLVIYGNTAEDLGQFYLEVDLDSSLTNTVSAAEGNLEDLPPALNPAKFANEEPISHLKALSLNVNESDISVEMKQFLHLSFKILEIPNLADAVNRVVDVIVSVASSYSTQSLRCASTRQKQCTEGRLSSSGDFHCDLTEVRKKLLDVCGNLENALENSSHKFLTENMFLESENDLATSKQLVEILRQNFFSGKGNCIVHLQLTQSKAHLLWLSMALLLCSRKESCFHFVNGGGMKHIGYVFSNRTLSSAVTLILLGVVEQATRHAIGCEGFLGWWPREDEMIPVGVSEGYNQLLKLLIQKQRHDVASLASCILHRIRFYEVASRYECAVLSAMVDLSAVGKITAVTLDLLTTAKLQLKMLLRLINSSGLIEDPSPVAFANRSLILGETDGLLSYKATRRLITLSNCCFSNSDIDSNLLFLLKERGFLPLSAAILSSSILRSGMGHTMDLFVDITSYIESIILSLVISRSGLLFLFLEPELSNTLILALRGADSQKQASIPLRYASILISKGFICRPSEVGIIAETHLRVTNIIDRLITSQPHSEELLWSLWELCCLSRSNCGRQALLAISYFPEAMSVLMAALDSIKYLEVSENTATGASPLNLAIFHSAVEIFEVIVTDTTSSSLGCWIDHAKELHEALHSSSPGSNRKDAPRRLLELIDGAVVYHRNGAAGLLRYAAVLASGGDAPMVSPNILSSDEIDVENAVGDVSNCSDGNAIDNRLGKPMNEARFLGVTLHDSSVAQLTTAFRILAFISENSVVAASLYDEGAVVVIHAVLIDCKLMLERSSNNYDYLVDEGTECNSTSDLLLERNREQSIVDLLIPTLLLLINMLQRLQKTKEQHRNTKLLKALLQLHRELSPKLAACAADVSLPYPTFALGCEAVCHLIASAVACWPAFGWTPCLFQFLLDSLHATSLLAMGPKETCSLLFLLNDLLPEEGATLWRDGMPMLSALRQLAVGTMLGPQKEREINWYLQAGHKAKLLGQLKPLLPDFAEIVLQCAISTLVVIQDMLRLFIIRMACIHADNASILLRPMIHWINKCLSSSSMLSDADAYKVYRLLDFLASLLEHPRAKPILLKDGVIQIFTEVLKSFVGPSNLDSKLFWESKSYQRSWCIPVSRFISMICDSRTSSPSVGNDRYNLKKFAAEDCSLLLLHLLRLMRSSSVGRELVACLGAFKELSSSAEGQIALLSIISHIRSSVADESESDCGQGLDGKSGLLNASELMKDPPLLRCLNNILTSVELEDVPLTYCLEASGALFSGASRFCIDGKSLNMKRVDAVKCLFGLPCDINGADGSFEDKMKHVHKLVALLGSKLSAYEYSMVSDTEATFYEVREFANSLLLLLQSTSSVKGDDVVSRVSPLLLGDIQDTSKIQKMSNFSMSRVEDYNLNGFVDKFMWECPENLRDRFSQTTLPAKRKLSVLDGASRRPRGDNSPAENMAQSSFSRGSGQFPAISGSSRRVDNFRLRKPNTSRPPSMHVDDYVARERNIDGSSSNVIAVPRLGSTGSGRPPSIHVDEFMARQRDRQNHAGKAVSAQVKTPPPENDSDAEKSSKSKQLRPDLDDDLQGLNIVFGGEESESDDGMPFPQPDDNLQQPSPVIVEQNSPRSIVEETESDINENSQFSHRNTPVSNVDENTQSDFSSRMSVSHPEMASTREPSISLDKKYVEQSEEEKHGPIKMERSSGFSSSVSVKRSGSSAQAPGDSRMQPPNLYPKASHSQGEIAPLPVISQQLYEQKFQMSHPPLPPMPPPPMISPVQSKPLDSISSQSTSFANSMQDAQPPIPPGFHVQSLSSPGGSVRPAPPLPPTPPPYSTASSSFPSLRTSTSQSSVYNQSNVGSTDLLQNFAPSNDARLANLSASGAILTSYPPPPLMPPLLFSRPASMSFGLYGTSSTPNQGENSPNFPIALSSIQSIQSVTQLQPLQPPQLPRPPQPPQHLRPPISASPRSDQCMSSLQNPMQIQVQQLQMLQPAQASPAHVYYQTMQAENYAHTLQQQRVDAQPQVLQQGHGSVQQEDESGMSLQHWFKSPEDITSLLNDRDKLRQLLEQHPKLVQLLQERLEQQ